VTISLLIPNACLLAKHKKDERGPTLARRLIKLGRLSLLQLIFIPIFCSAQTKSASTAAEIYERTHSSIVIVLAADDDAKPIGQGSGFIISQDRIVTNHHVLEGASSVLVVFADGISLSADGIVADSSTRDLTILAVKTGTRPVLKLGDELSVHQGDQVYAIGAPRGLELSITNGIVSGFRQLDEQFLIQNTAPIAPGSSGGPLFDQDGQVVGVTSLLLTDSPGIYFSIASGDVGRLLRAPNPIIAPIAKPSVSVAHRPSHAAPYKPVQNKVNGTFEGRIKNTTANLGANFSLAIAQDKQKLYGCMAVYRPLYGSGPLNGVREGDKISFEVIGPVFQIRFQGTITNNVIAGSYRVLKPADQTGFFELYRKSSSTPESPFAPTKCPTDD
jgi:S1-C subfamily serine protease